MCLIASISSQREHQTRERGSRMGGPFYAQDIDSTVQCTRSWAWISMLQPCNGSKEKTHRIVGDRLLIPTFHQLPQVRTFPAWDKYKHTQSLPLKEDFRQCARPGNSRVSRLHEEESSIPQCQLLISKAMQVLKRTEQLRVPGNSQTESASHS